MMVSNTPKDFSFTGYNKNHRDVARRLRKEMTPQERHLLHAYLKNYSVKFYRQRAIDRFIVDFYCQSAKLVVELDGSQHYTANGIEYDAERTKILEQYGLTVLRFSNMDIDNNFEGVCSAIHSAVQNTANQ